jgi:hypothetical protein
MAPVAIGRDTVVGDRFSGYEWRVVLEAGRSVLLAAFVIPPDPGELRLVAFASNEAAVLAGGSRVRRCDPELTTIRCGRVARGLVRLVGDRLELVVAEPLWYQLASGREPAIVHLGVRRAGVPLWEETLTLRPDP